ncbi:hypothetical protein AB0M41_25695 [Streptomyces sp. NPDC051896]|uniref:hypothetical protein n=1 Tax=Streptomyces sp. NPDC051896 TaxID=3155416 RepID=UPI0034177ABE
MAALEASVGVPIRTLGELESWMASVTQSEQEEPFTYTVDIDGVLRIAPRRSEHVACAGGKAVLAAGEISFTLEKGSMKVSGVSNHSTGYCPDSASWEAVECSLNRIGVRHPGSFTEIFIFRRCPACMECNLVKDSHFFCAFCEESLPEFWNIDASDAAKKLPVDKESE